MIYIAYFISWLNSGMNFLCEFLKYLIAGLPGWLSITAISAVTGVFLLIVFKHTSNQKAIGCTRDKIKAQLLAMKLFKDFIPVVLKSQVRILVNAFLLLFHSLRPTAVMIIPFSLLLGQLGLWYQARPLKVGEEAVITMQLSGSETDAWPQVILDPSSAIQITTDGVRVFSKREIFWKAEALQAGQHQLTFLVDGQPVEKDLAVGEGFMRVSGKRPGYHIADLFMHPFEKPFDGDSAVQSIQIGYPDRVSKINGTDWWVFYLFIASMVFALALKPVLKVKF